MYQAMYRKYRPNSFEDVVGQKVIIKTLSNAVLNDKISHAYLFCGPRGTGKTTVAKIFAKIVNCEKLNGVKACDECVSCTQNTKNQNTDIIEIDAASNNGVEEIRDLRDKVNLVPSYGKYKVYIIDEVHMLTTAAFNALLKTLEEPPKHIIFILATTDPQKIPQTILSRCQRFDFNKISEKDIIDRLKVIIEKEKIDIELSAIDKIAKLSDGGLRDSISLLDQLTSYTNEKITDEDINLIYGTVTNTEIYNLLISIFDNNLTFALEKVKNYNEQGKNLTKIMELMIEFLKNTLIYNINSNFFESDEEKTKYLSLIEKVSEEKIYDSIEIIVDTIQSCKTTNNIKLLFELAIIRMSKKNDNIQNNEEVKIFDDSRVIVKQPNYEVKKITNVDKSKLLELKQIRINNTLCNFDKKDLLEFKKKIDLIRELLIDPDYSAYASLILDGELKAKGKNNLLFVYKIKNLEEFFNNSIKKVERALEITFKENLLPIAITEEEWEPIKKEFNKNIKNNINTYKYIEEPKVNFETQIEKKESSEIDILFKDLVEYK